MCIRDSSKTYNARKISSAPLLTLIDGAGVVRGVQQGGDLAQAALAMLDGVIPPSTTPVSYTHLTLPTSDLV